MSSSPGKVQKHYGFVDVASSVFGALRKNGKNLETLTVSDLAPLDQFHVGGKEATLELASLVNLPSACRILDIGGGLGGPARLLASEYGSRVEVLDLTEEYCKVGQALTKLTGLSSLVSFNCSDATQLSYLDESFDIVWSQHSSMNIGDKQKLYSNVYRVLRRGGLFALHEIMAGELQPIHYPTPWAREPSISFLRPPEEIRSILSRLGFEEVAWVDKTEAMLEWFERQQSAINSVKPVLGIHLLLGPDFPQMFLNQIRNLKEGRIKIIQGVARR